MKSTYKLFGYYVDGVKRESQLVASRITLELDYKASCDLLDYCGYKRTILYSELLKANDLSKIVNVINSKLYSAIYVIDDVFADNRIIDSFVSIRLHQYCYILKELTRKEVFIVKKEC